MEYKARLKRNIFLFNLTSFFTALVFLIPIWVNFERRIVSYSVIAIYTAIASVSTTILELPSGALADLLGRKKTIFIGYLINGLATAFLSLASLPVHLYLGYGLISIGSALVSGADTALLFDSLKELGEEKNFSKYFSVMGLVHRSALGLASLLGGYLYQIWIGLPYLAHGVSLLIATLIFGLMQEPKIDTEKFSLNTYITQTKIGFNEILKNTHIKLLSAYYVLVGSITWACIFYFNQPFALEVGFNEISRSWVFSATYFITSIVLILLTRSEKLLTRKRVYLSLPIIIGLALIPANFSGKIYGAIILLLTQLTGSARFAILNEYTNLEFQSRYRATAISALNMLVSIVSGAFIFFGGQVQEAVGTGLIYTVLGVFTLITVFPVAFKLINNS